MEGEEGGSIVRIYEKAPAKINLTLDVLYKREDGYHEVEMIMTMVDLADRVELELISDRDQILLDSSSSYIPLDERNLAYRAAQLLQDEYGVNQGVKIYIDKHIPIAAGLAGGSSDAAATLRGLNRLWQLNLSTERLMELGARLGSDIPFCVKGGTALATGRGEQIQSLPSPPACWVIMAKPPISVSTADVYTHFSLDKVEARPSNYEMIRAFHESNYDAMVGGLCNVLETVTFERYSGVRQLKECMERLGVDGVLMSGSGPTIFGLVQKESKVARIVNGLKGFCRDVYAVRLLTSLPKSV
jgi:4-diphosphocytidyl-2-C-methyl-D-erythritol kinase